MKTAKSKYLLWSVLIAALAAVIIDGFMSGRGLGVMIFCGVTAVAIIAGAFLELAGKPSEQAAVRPASGVPIFAHVPGPGEPGYDPNYDPDDDKYWRRYYGGDD